MTEVMKKLQEYASEANVEADKLNALSGFLDIIASENRTERKDFVFTELQKEAMSSSCFWRRKGNLLVQGPTSSGKTLTAELQMAYHLYCTDEQRQPAGGKWPHKVIYLVPLKALTSEKIGVFKRHFPGMDVYASSSDYQEHDGLLSQGKYHIGVLVYEKLFALASQSNGRLLDGCSLVVVDEIQSLNDAERGFRLEFAIEKVRRIRHEETRIMGMTTIDIDTCEVKRWLNNAEMICSRARPVGIEENFIYASPDSDEGRRIRVCTGTDGKSQAPEDIYEEEVFKVDSELSDAKYYGGNRNRFFQLLNLLKWHTDDKIIIFLNSRRAASNFIDTIVGSGVLRPNQQERNDIPSQEESELPEREYRSFSENLRKYSIAYHNAGLSHLMRNYIEESFRSSEKNCVRIIVTTETITMGLNMPVDVVVLFDSTVFRGDASPVEIGYQWYKNTVGRAGRFGIATKGVSYLLCEHLEDVKRFYNKFTNNNEKIISCPPEPISDTGRRPEKERQFELARAAAPYYLDLFNTGKIKSGFTRTELNEIVKNGLERRQNAEDYVSNILSALQGFDHAGREVGLKAIIKQDNPEADIYGDSEEYYTLSVYANKVSSYVLSTMTMNAFYKVFLGGHRLFPRYQADAYTINPPPLVSKERNEQCQSLFFELMYIILTTPEIYYKSMNADGPSTPGNRKNNSIDRQLSRFANRCFRDDASHDLLLKSFDFQGITDEKRRLLYRMALLFFWVNGQTVLEIREKLGFPDEPDYYIYSSDLETLAEKTAYYLDAAAHALETSEVNLPDYPEKDRRALRTMLCDLSACVKYGMPRDCARLAAQQVRGVTRRQLVKLGVDAKSKGLLVDEYLLRTEPEILCKEKGVPRANALSELQNCVRQRYRKVTNNTISDVLTQLCKDNPGFEEISEKLDSLDRLSNQRWSETLQGVFYEMDLSARQGAGNRVDVQLAYHFTAVAKQEKIAPSDSGKCVFIFQDSMQPISETQKDPRFISALGLKLMLVKSMAAKGELPGSGDYFLKLVDRHLVEGENLFLDGRIDNALEEIIGDVPYVPPKPISAPAAPNEEPKLMVQNNQNNQYNYYINIHQNIDKQINVAQRNINIQQIYQEFKQLKKPGEDADDSEIVRYLGDAAVKLESLAQAGTQEGKDPDEQCIEIVEKYNPAWKGTDTVKWCQNMGDGIWDILRNAIIVDEVIRSSMSDLDEFSPCAILFCKSMENMLNRKLLPYLKQQWCAYKWPDINGRAGKKLVDVQTLMLGEYSTVCKRLKPNSSSQLQKKDLDSLTQFLEDFNGIRVRTCHDSSKISNEDIQKIKSYTKAIIPIISSLQTGTS